MAFGQTEGDWYPRVSDNGWMSCLGGVGGCRGVNRTRTGDTCACNK